MQDGWGSGGEEIGMNTGQWDADDGDAWNSPTSQDSSCNSWGQSKKGPQRVSHFKPRVLCCIMSCHILLLYVVKELFM